MSTLEQGLAIAADLIAPDSHNPYLLDAAGFLRATQHIVAGNPWPDSAARTTAAALEAVGNYAAASDNSELAEHVFGQEGLAGRWRLYGIAAVTGTIDRHPDWSLWASSDETLEHTNRSQPAKTAMLVTKTKIALADYAVAEASGVSKRKALSTAVANKQEALTTANSMNGKEYATPIRLGEAEEYGSALDSLFAERGIWQEVDSPFPPYPLREVAAGNQLVAKAAVGELSRRDQRKIKNVWALHDLFAVNALAQGEDVPPVSATRNSRLVGNSLLAAAAPRAFVHLGLARSDQLSTYLQVG